MDDTGCRSSTDCDFDDGNGETEGISSEQVVDPVVAKGVGLARDLVLHLLGESGVRRDRLSLCLRTAVIAVLEKHPIVFNRYAKRLAVIPGKKGEILCDVCDSVFQENYVTWCHIVWLYALAGRLALYYEEKNMPKLARRLPQHMTRCIAKNIAPFVKRNGGWEQLFVQYPLKEDLSGKVWTSLLVTGVGLILAAALFALHS